MGEDAVSTCLQLKFWSMLEKSEAETSSPLPIISRFRSIFDKIVCTSLPVNLLYDLIDALSEFRIHGLRLKSRASRKGIFGVFTISPLSDFLFMRSMRIRLDDIEKKLSSADRVPDEAIPRLEIPSSEIQQTYPDTDVSRIIGFESHAKRIEDFLFDTVNEEGEGLTWIWILGWSRCGKTALSQKVFASPNIVYNFPTRIWICLSNMLPFDQPMGLNRTTSPSPETVRALNSILRQIGYEETELESVLTVFELWEKFVEMLQDRLREKKYLIVLDDARHVDHWFSAFPRGSNCDE